MKTKTQVPSLRGPWLASQLHLTLPAIPRKRGPGAATLWLLIGCALLGFLSVGRWSAGAATLSIPGVVTVTIEPAEAVESGARWSIDNGPLQASDESVANLAAG